MTAWHCRRVCANCGHAEEMHRTRVVSVAPCRVLRFDLDLGDSVYCGCACFTRPSHFERVTRTVTGLRG